MRLKAVLREPLVHFLAIGAALFLYFHWNGGGSGPTSSRIVLTRGQIEHLSAGFVKTWQRPPTAVELKGLMDDWLREEIAVREAMAAGLDRDDTIIRRRLRQKLEFVVEDIAATAPPTDEELSAWLSQHADRFRVEPQVAFRQVYVSRDRRGAAAEADARAILAQLERAGAEARIDELGDPLLLPQENDLAAVSDVARAFGQELAERLQTIAPGAWAGPVESSFGLHLVLVRRRVEGSIPELAMVRPAVEREMGAERHTRQLAEAYQRLLAKYTVVIEKLEQDERASATATSGS